MLKIVLDANILVSAFLTPRGESSEILRYAQTHKLYLSPHILAEVWNTLHYARIRKKYHYSDDAIERHIKNLAIVSDVIEPKSALNACHDPKDNAVLACAVEVIADYLVTRNTKHFPRSYADVTILSPREFLPLVKTQ